MLISISSTQLCSCILATGFACLASSFSFQYGKRFPGSCNSRQGAFGLFAGYSISDIGKDDVPKPKRLMIFGLGNVGKLIALRSASLTRGRGGERPYFDRVYGTTRKAGREIPGVEIIDFDSPKEIERVLPSCTHVLVTIPPVEPSSDSDVSTDADTRLKYMRNIFRRFMCDPVMHHPALSVQDLVPAKTWVGYISSTAVYGNHDAEWVTEYSAVRCGAGTKGELYVRSENEWRMAAMTGGWELHIFRAAGLYGRERSAIHTIRKFGPPRTDDARSRESGAAADPPTSRIHEEDAVAAILSAMTYEGDVMNGDCNVWNLADDNPAPRLEVMAFGSKLLEEANLLPEREGSSPRTRSPPSERERRRSTDRKRVDNNLMKDRLLPDGKLLYPTYEEGLRAVLDANREEWLNRASGPKNASNNTIKC